MRAIRNATNHELEWVQPQLASDAVELRIVDGELLAKLVMRGSNGAYAVSSEGAYAFQRQGLFKTRTLAYSGDSRTPMATLAVEGDESVLRFADGRAQRYLWRKAAVGSNDYLWLDADGTPLIQFWPARVAANARVRFQPKAAQVQEAALLVLLGSFLTSRAYWDVMIPAIAITILNREQHK